MSTPDTALFICSGVPLNNTYEHTLYFEDKTQQEIYFITKNAASFLKYSFMRPEHKIKVVGDFNDAHAWNYLYFQNPGGKRFYHFINKVEYINDNTVELSVELDVIQTFMFDWDLQACLIERTHTPTDVFGEHTIPEGLETGPLVRYSTSNIALNDCYIMMLASCQKNGYSIRGRMYGGVYSGLACYAIPVENLDKFEEWLNTAERDGFIDAIVSMWMYPKVLVNADIPETLEDQLTEPFFPVTGVKTYSGDWFSDPFKIMYPNDAHPELLNGVSIHNKKTLCYPYTQLYVTNNMGGCAVYHRERFTDQEYTFKLYGALSPESGVKLAPENYKNVLGDTINYEEGLTMPAFPTCAWNADVYKVWLAQNMASQQTTIQQAKTEAFLGGLGAVAGIAGGVATGNALAVVGGVASGFMALKNTHNTIQNIMAQRQDMSVQPDQARGQQSASVNLGNSRMGFTLCWLCPTPEYIQSIDDYFTHYGYRVNQFGVPSLKNRDRFTYVKTAGALVLGPFTAEYQRRIQDIFDHGITFWAYPNAVGDYSERNLTL